MCRGRDSRRRLVHLITLLTCSAALAFTSCVFSPEKKPPRPIDPPPGKPEDLIRVLQNAYQQRDYDTFASLLSAEPGAEYLFLLNEPTPDGERQWGRTEELRIHQRMFRPEDIPPGDPPLPTELWLVSIDISLTLRESFVELGASAYQPANPDGLDPARWKGFEAVYRTHVLFDTQGSLDYVVNGTASFQVIEDLTKQVGNPGKFLIYRWEDLGGEAPKPAAGPAA